jgi:chromosome segregation protein
LRLTSVRLSGFKSFVDPTTIAVPGQLVGVVGPNGCGKSNVIDAVRWVLGESSAKQLRGEHMADVIFNGSSDRKPVSRASVELVFDNSLGRIGGAWAGYNEISVKRVLTREGDSNYYLNGQHVRRRDVQDIFLGTGLGPRAYSIIEQGMISRVITSKPEELRVFLEEAAGVSKYRERRRETELRLEDTRENLSRVGDIRSELGTQLEHLAQQAEVAAKYNELQAQLTLNTNLIAFTRLREAEQSRNRFANEVQKAQVALEAETAKLRESERALEELRSRHYQETDHLGALQGALYAANADVQSLEQEIAYLGDTRKRMSTELERIGGESAEVGARIAAANAERDRCASEVEGARAAIGEREADVARAREALPAAEAKAQEAAAAVRAAEAEMSTAEQAQGVEETRESHALKLLSQLEARKNRLKQENMGLVFPEPEKLKGIESERAEAASRIAVLERASREAESRVPILEDERRTATDRLQEANREVAGLEAALKALEGQQQRLEANARVADWSQAHGLDRAEHLWQTIHVESGWDDAVEAALGVRLNAVRLADESNLATLLRDPPPGNFAVFVERGIAENPPASRLTPLSSVVTCSRPPIASYVADALANVFILPEGEEGMALARVLPPGGLLVSRAGHLFSRQGVVFHGPQSELHGVLQRQREIEDLQSRIPVRSRERADIEARVREVEVELRDAQEATRRGREALATARQADHDLEVEYLKLSQSSQQSEKRREAIREELAAIEEDEARERPRNAGGAARARAGITGDRGGRAAAAGARGSGEAGAARPAGRARSRSHKPSGPSRKRASTNAAARSAPPSQSQLALSLGERLQALTANRDKVSTELAQLEEGQVRERLQAALEVRRERERTLAEARSGLGKPLDAVAHARGGAPRSRAAPESAARADHGAAHQGAGSGDACGAVPAAARRCRHVARRARRADREARAFLVAPGGDQSPGRGNRGAGSGEPRRAFRAHHRARAQGLPRRAGRGSVQGRGDARSRHQAHRPRNARAPPGNVRHGQYRTSRRCFPRSSAAGRRASSSPARRSSMPDCRSSRSRPGRRTSRSSSCPAARRRSPRSRSCSRSSA